MLTIACCLGYLFHDPAILTAAPDGRQVLADGGRMAPAPTTQGATHQRLAVRPLQHDYG